MSTQKKAASSAPSRVIDLDGARAARKEAEPVTLKFGGKEFNLPGELPFRFAELAGESKLNEALIELLGDEQAVEFASLKPSTEDLTAFSEAIVEVYGLEEAGKSQASAS